MLPIKLNVPNQDITSKFDMPAKNHKINWLSSGKVAHFNCMSM